MASRRGSFVVLRPASGTPALRMTALVIRPRDIIRAMKATVTVELKPSVLDPQGKAIEHALSSLGFTGVEDVRVGKLFRVSLANDGQPREQIEAQLRQMCERLLANTVVEKFSYTLDE